MAMKHFLKIYPVPERPTVYTGLFEKRWSKRRWSNKPNKIINGVSQTKYADAMRISVGRGMSLFDFIHGKCGFFADYFHEQNPEWAVVDMMRGNSWNTMIHSYCIKEINGITYFADARGITDDPKEFFSDFTCGDNMYVRDHNDYVKHAKNNGIHVASLSEQHPKFIEKVVEAYSLVYEKGAKDIQVVSIC